jgi:ketosteroid isomerase-like protein
MSRENIDWVRQAIEAWARGDISTVQALSEGRLTPDCEFHPLYLDRVYRGADALSQVFTDVTETWADYRMEPEDIVDLGAYVLVQVRITARGVGSGVPVEQRVAMLGRFDAGKLVWGKSFASKAEALEAVRQGK